MSKSKVSIFYSYSRKDEDLRDELHAHLSTLKRSGLIDQWYDGKIDPGTNPHQEIDENIEKADLILALISSDFVDSDYCYSKELARALSRHNANEAVLLPILVRACDWEDQPISQIQSLPTGLVAVTSWKNIDEAWMDVAAGIRKAVSTILTKRDREGEGKGFSTLNDLLWKEIDRIDMAAGSDGQCGGFSTGISLLDEMTDGIHLGEFALIASRPSHGADFLARQIAAQSAIHEQIPVAYFSMALPADTLVRHLLSSEAKVHQYKMLKGYLTEEDWPNFNQGVALLKDAPLYIDESSNLTFSELLTSIESAVKDKEVAMVIVDDIQGLKYQADDAVSSIPLKSRANELKRLARELNIAIIAVSNLKKELENRPNKRPLLHDLDTWPGIDDVADLVIFPYRHVVYHYDHFDFDPESAELIVARSTNGPIGTVKAIFDSDSCTFRDCPQESEVE